MPLHLAPKEEFAADFLHGGDIKHKPVIKSTNKEPKAMTELKNEELKLKYILSL